MLLIVNADDLGANSTINSAIFDLMELGAVTSATLVTNAPAYEEAVQQICHFPRCSFGVHLNLTAFRPLSGSKRLQSILRDGKFCRGLLTNRAVLALRAELEMELTMQVQCALDAGVQVSHLDSHHFFHIRGALIPIIRNVQRRVGIRRLRSSFEAASGGGPWKDLRGKAARFAIRRFCSATTPDAWCRFQNLDDAVRNKTLPIFDSLELMVHPGAQTSESSNEASFLNSDWRNRLPDGIQLGNYHQIAVANHSAEVHSSLALR
jgi:chitin disaccharide deacetylase